MKKQGAVSVSDGASQAILKSSFDLQVTAQAKKVKEKLLNYREVDGFTFISTLSVIILSMEVHLEFQSLPSAFLSTDAGPHTVLFFHLFKRLIKAVEP